MDPLGFSSSHITKGALARAGEPSPRAAVVKQEERGAARRHPDRPLTGQKRAHRAPILPLRERFSPQTKSQWYKLRGTICTTYKGTGIRLPVLSSQPDGRRTRMAKPTLSSPGRREHWAGETGGQRLRRGPGSPQTRPHPGWAQTSQKEKDSPL